MSIEDLIEYQEANQEPGKGQGVGQPKQGQGGFSSCVCPNCGHTEAHSRGAPCNSMSCPECGSSLVGK